MLLSFCVEQFKCLRDGWSWDSVNMVWGMENNTSKAAPVRRIRIILRQCHDVPWLPSSLLHRKCVLVFDSFSINKWNIIRKALTSFGFHFVTCVEKYQNILMHILARLLQDTTKAWWNQLHARLDLDKPFFALVWIMQLEIPPWSSIHIHLIILHWAPCTCRAHRLLSVQHGLEGIERKGSNEDWSNEAKPEMGRPKRFRKQDGETVSNNTGI